MYIKWAVLALLDWVLLITIPIAAPIIAAFTRMFNRELGKNLHRKQ